MTHKCNPEELNLGEWLSRISYIKIISREKDGFNVQNEEGTTWFIDKDIVSAECYSVQTLQQKEEVVTRSRLAQIVKDETRGCVFKCCFLKAVTQASLEETLLQLTELPSTMKKVDLKKVSKELLKGEKRELTGYFVDVDESTGRFKVVDLNADGVGQARFRQVDPRTLEWVIIRGVKYVAK